MGDRSKDGGWGSLVEEVWKDKDSGVKFYQKWYVNYILHVHAILKCFIVNTPVTIDDTVTIVGTDFHSSLF